MAVEVANSSLAYDRSTKLRLWEREIRAFEQGIARAQRRSERKR